VIRFFSFYFYLVAYWGDHLLYNNVLIGFVEDQSAKEMGKERCKPVAVPQL
jgi:hypothetical protein